MIFDGGGNLGVGYELEALIDLRSSLDNRVDIGDKEKRMGMRAGLRNYQKTWKRMYFVPETLRKLHVTS